MKRNLRGLIVCVSIFLTVFVLNGAFAAEKTGPVKGTAGKAGVLRYDETARGVNAPMYDYYAQRIKEATGMTKGVCLDVGSGGGYLGLSLAKITNLDFIFLDISADALERAKLHIVEDGLQNRARTLLADVHSIPLDDGSVDLVISRGSIPFWKDPALGLREIYRVLAPGGKAYVGGGRGIPEIQAQIAARRKELGLNPQSRPKGSGPVKMAQRNYDEILKKAGIKKYSVNTGDDGMWIQM